VLRPTLSEAVDAVIAKALAPTAKKRWASASTFALALARALQRVPEDHVEPVRQVEDERLKHAESLFAPTASITGAAQPSEIPGEHRMITGQVRAAHLRVLSKLLQHNLGEGGMAKLVGEVPALATALAPTLSPLGWVDLSELIQALERARQKVPSQLVPRKVGRGTISATFAHLFGADPSSIAAETVLAALPSFWDRYHVWGGIEVAVQPGSADVVLTGFPGHADVCAMIAAELERIVELTGAVAVAATHTACTLLGAEHCTYRMSWSLPA